MEQKRSPELGHRLVAWGAIVVVAWAAGTSRADERITDFRCDIVVAEDGLMTVAETIGVVSTGKKIKQGIYRDIPVRYGGGWFGLGVTVPFTIERVECDGAAAAFHTERLDGVERIFIGEKGRAIPPGPHTYVIVYTTRQVRFFADHDEVYWNATGHAWDFPIDRVEATVALPSDVPLAAIDVEAYVGKLGSTNQRDVRATVDLADQRAVFVTTRPLGRHEGMSIVARFPKGFVAEATWLERLVADPFVVWAGLAMVVVAGYFGIAWWLVGRDPPGGLVFPEFAPPHGLSPAALRFIDRMGFDRECFTVALLSLASQGVIAIKEEDGDYSLERTADAAPKASPGERLVLAELLGDRSAIDVDRKHQETFTKAISQLKKSLVEEFEGDLFRPNRWWFFTGVAISVCAVLLALFVGGGASLTGKVGFLSLWLSIWSAGVVMLVHTAIVAWRVVAAGGPATGRLLEVGGAVLITLFAVPFVAAEVFVVFLVAQMTSLWLIPLLLGIVAINALMYELIKAPTAKGRPLMDAIHGFRMYLSTAEQDRLDATAWRGAGNVTERERAPPGTLATFEQFFPYAVALGVGNAWADQFRHVVAAAATTPQAAAGYRPPWYHGNAWSPATIGATAAGIGSAMSAAVAAAASSPGGSSGGGGGGSSGGGGGGGGGGGW
jgi:uncharacterized membrane protein YgcG